jgi:hypothetical protein
VQISRIDPPLLTALGRADSTAYGNPPTERGAEILDAKALAGNAFDPLTTRSLPD